MHGNEDNNLYYPASRFLKENTTVMTTIPFFPKNSTLWIGAIAITLICTLPYPAIAQLPATQKSDEVKNARSRDKNVTGQSPIEKLFTDIHPTFPDVAVLPDGPGEEWVSIGPKGMPLSNNDVISGQVNVIAVHPTDANTLYIGASEGGVWKTTDGGLSWSPITDYQLVRNTITGQRKGTLSIGALAINPSNTNIVYAGTGDPNRATSIVGPGLGVFRTFNGGTHWNPTGIALLQTGCNNDAMARAVVNRIIVTGGNPGVAFAATNQGLMRYIENGSDCWTLMTNGLPVSGDAIDLTLDQFRGVFYVAFAGQGIFKSTDLTGQAWTKLTNGLPDSGFGRIAVTFGGRTLGFSTPKQLLYAGYAMNTDTYRLFKTADGGATWAELPSPPSQGQLGFNNALAVGLYNSDEVYVGQIALWRATDGGAKGGVNNFKVTPPVTDNSWFSLSCCLAHPHVNPFRQGLDLHADIHDVVFAPVGSFMPLPSQTQIVFIANDGGVTRGVIDFEGVVTWESLTNGLAISQVGTIGLNPRSPTVTASGIWHNGNAWTLTGAFSALFGGGDGFQTTIDAGAIEGSGFIHFIAYQNCNAGFGGEICRSRITSPSSSTFQGTIWDDKNAVKFWSDPYRAGHLLRLQKDDGLIYRTTIAHTGAAEVLRSPRPWQVIDATIGKKGKSTTLAFRSALLEQLPVYYIGTDSGQIWRGSPEAGWSKICDCGLPVNAISPDLRVNERIYAVFKAANGPGRIKELIRNPNQTWTVRNIDGQFFSDLQVSQVTSIAADPMIPESQGTTVYVGTDQGVYRGHKQTQVILESAAFVPTIFDWVWTRSSGVPNVLVLDMEVHQSIPFNDRAGIIRAGTYGRSVFELRRGRGRDHTRYPHHLDVTAMILEEDGVPPAINADILVVTEKGKAVRAAPFSLSPASGTITLEAPYEVRFDGGTLKFVGWVVSGKRQGDGNKVTIDVKETMTVVAYYELGERKLSRKSDVMRVHD